jgi:hypothetical protein
VPRSPRPDTLSRLLIREGHRLAARRLLDGGSARAMLDAALGWAFSWRDHLPPVQYGVVRAGCVAVLRLWDRPAWRRWAERAAR